MEKIKKSGENPMPEMRELEAREIFSESLKDNKKEHSNEDDLENNVALVLEEEKNLEKEREDSFLEAPQEREQKEGISVGAIVGMIIIVGALVLGSSSVLYKYYRATLSGEGSLPPFTTLLAPTRPADREENKQESASSSGILPPLENGSSSSPISPLEKIHEN